MHETHEEGVDNQGEMKNGTFSWHSHLGILTAEAVQLPYSSPVEPWVANERETTDSRIKSAYVSVYGPRLVPFSQGDTKYESCGEYESDVAKSTSTSEADISGSERAERGYAHP